MSTWEVWTVWGQMGEYDNEREAAEAAQRFGGIVVFNDGTNPASGERMTPQEFAASYDWRAALEHNPQGFTPSKTEGFEGSTEPFGFSDIAEVIACVEGENDGADWLAVLRLRDNRFISVVAGCDYTGWDCQSGMRSVVAATLPELIRWGMSEEQRERLGFTLDEAA